MPSDDPLYSEPLDLSKLKGKPAAKSFQEIDAMLKIPSDPRSKVSKKPTDWHATTRAYVTQLALAAEKMSTAKDAMAPAGEFPVKDEKILKTFLAFGKYEYQKEVWDKNRVEMGLPPEEKMARLGKTPEQLEADIAQAEQTLKEVGAAYQNDLADILPDLEQEREELQTKLKKATDFEKKTAIEPDPVGAVKPSEIDNLGSNVLRRPRLDDRERTTFKTQKTLGDVLQRITRVHEGIDTIQKILAGDRTAIGAAGKDPRFTGDNQIARFYALSWLIINRNLVQIKLGVIKRREDATRRPTHGPVPAPHADIPERPAGYPTEPPLESYRRFVDILGGIGPVAAIKYANLVTMPLKSSVALLESAFLQLRGFKGKEEFLNGRYCHLVESRNNGLVVKLVDADIHQDDRTIFVKYEEAALVDGRLKK